MAKSLLSTRSTRKTDRRRPSADQKRANAARMGGEPTFDNRIAPLTQTEENRCFGWYHDWYTDGNGSRGAFKQFIIDYLQHSDTVKARAFDAVPDVWVPMTAAKVLRMIDRGAYFRPEVVERAIRAVDEAITKHTGAGGEETEEQRAESATTVEEARLVYVAINAAIENGTQIDIAKTMRDGAVSVAAARHVLNRLQSTVEALRSSGSGRVSFYTGLVDGVKSFLGIRGDRVRRSRPVDPSRATRNVRYKARSDELGVDSVDPASIVGASEVWLLNERYGLLSCVRASEGGRLGVNGTTVTGFNETRCETRRVGRHLARIVPVVQSAEAGRIIDVFAPYREKREALKTTGRMNLDTLILRTVR